MKAGFLAAVAACLLWGIYPFYFKALGGTHPLEAMAHRIVWAVPTLAVWLTWRGEWGPLRRALTARTTFLGLALTGGLITLNWTVYVAAVFNEKVLDTSLGYFMGPLVTVVLGVVVLKERLGRLQLLAVGIAALAVLNLVVGLGVVPVVSLTLAASFSLYGLVRKRLPVTPAVGLMGECLVALPVALGYLAFIAYRDGLAFGTAPGLTLLLLMAGPLTVAPLLLFNLGAKRLPLSTVGIVLYLIPTLLFLEGVFVFGEPAGPLRLLTFALIWLALGLYSFDAVRGGRRSNGAVANESVSRARSP